MIHSYEKTVLLTGAGGGIGYEAAKAFANMGLKIIIVDIDADKGEKAMANINATHSNAATFYQTDLSEETQVEKLCSDIFLNFGCPDVIFHNATCVTLGKVENVGIDAWDKGYAVNLKAPVQITSYFLPHMKKRNTGCLVFVSSSGAAPYMGAYEVFKTAQVELSNTLALELENTHVYSYTIGPGLVKTDTAQKSIEIIASQINMSTEEFYKINEAHILEAADAGLGFALSVINAEKYHGQEISSIQVLNDFNYYDQPTNEAKPVDFNNTLLLKIIDTFQEQYNGWQKMNIFERQWVLRDFKKSMGSTADKVYTDFSTLEKNPFLILDGEYWNLFKKLKAYWERQLELLQGYEKNKKKLAENSNIIKGWIEDINTLLSSFEQ